MTGPNHFFNARLGKPIRGHLAARKPGKPSLIAPHGAKRLDRALFRPKFFRMSEEALPHPFRMIADDLAFLDDWEERYRYIIDLGRALPPLSTAEYNEANKVRGCASQVWLVREQGAGGTLTFRGDSDALIVKGLIALVLALYSGRTPAQILATDAAGLLGEIGLKEHLTAQRSNGLFSMVGRIRDEAAASAAA